MVQIKIKERLDERFSELGARRDAPVDQKRIELAAFAENLCGPVIGKSPCLQVRSESIKVGTERAAPEIHQRAFFFVPMFEHGKSCVFLLSRFLVENGGAKMNDQFFDGEDPPSIRHAHVQCFLRPTEKPLHL